MIPTPTPKNFRKLVEEYGKFFDEQLEYIRRSSIGTPKSLHLELGVAFNDLPFDIAGNFFYILHSGAQDHYIDIKFNEQREPAFRLYQYMGFTTPFYRFYITAPAQAAGTMDIVYGTLSRDFLDIIDNRSALSADLTAIRENLQGDTTPEGYAQVIVNAVATLLVPANVNRKSLIIQHRIAGVGSVYLGYDNLVTGITNFCELLPGDTYEVDDYRGDIWGIRSAGVTWVQYGEV